MSEPETGGRAARYRVLAVEPDERLRTRMTIELAGIAPAPVGTPDEIARALEPGEAVVLLCGPSFATDTGLAQLQRFGRSYPEVGIVLLASEITMPLLQQALRAGVRDVVVLDAGEHAVRQSIERVGDVMAAVVSRAAAAAEPEHEARVIVSFSTKGGVGKSVVSTNLAVALALANPGRVALVDADLQFGDVAVLLGVPPVSTTLEAAGAIDTADTQFFEGLLGTHEASSLRVLPAPVEPSAADSIRPDEMIGIIKMLRRMFDYVIVDMPPHFDDTVLALLEEADDVLLVASMDIPSIKNLKVGIQTLDLLSLAGPKLRLVLNRANARVNLDISDVERALGVTAEFRIPSDISVPQAVNRGVPVVIDRPRSSAALALRGLAESIASPARSDTPAHEQPQPTTRRRGWLGNR